MKSSTESYEELQRTSELEKPKRARKNQDEQRKTQKVQMETRFKGGRYWAKRKLKKTENLEILEHK